MKKEGPKKSLKWLWIVLAALLLLGGGAAALIFGLGGQEAGDAYMPLYWNIDRSQFAQGSATGMSSRKPAADGIYYVRFMVDGQVKEIPVVDKRLVNMIDTMDVLGLVLDENGAAVNAIQAKNIAKELTKKSYVSKVTGDTIHANSSITFNGMTHKLKITEGVKVYDVDPKSETFGRVLAPSDLNFLDVVIAYGNKETGELTHVFMVSHPDDTKVYWRYDPKAAVVNPVELGDDGAYTFRFACEGQMVSLSTKDEEIANEIRSKGYLVPYLSFKFDEDGYIVETVNAQAGLFGLLACSKLEVRELNGRTFTAIGMFESDQGTTYTATLPDDCPIYDVSEAAARDGRFGQEVDSLQMEDRVSVWTDPDGNPKFVYIQNRIVGPGYWIHPGCQWDSEKQTTTRKPDSKGWYKIDLVKNGDVGVKTYKTQDKELVEYLDAQGRSQVVGLKVDGDIIQQVYNSESVYGYAAIYRGCSVTAINGNLVTVAAGSNSYTMILDDDFKAYDMSGYNERGTEIELKVGDVVESHRDLSYKIQVSYVTSRVLGEKTLYYNVARVGLDSKGNTTRTPDENGYYVFKMLNYQGKEVTVKTKKKDIATQIDAVGNLCMSLVVNKSGVVSKVLDAKWALGKFLTGYMVIEKIHSDGTLDLTNEDGSYKLTIKKGDKCKIYNMSTYFDSRRGEKVSKLKVGDTIAAFAAPDNTVEIIFIRDKNFSTLLYPAKKTSVPNWTPDAEGFYYVEALKEGKLTTYKTKDLTLAQTFYNKSGAFTIQVKTGNELKFVSDAYHCWAARPQYGTGWQVVKISGKTVTLQYQMPGDKDFTGKKVKITLASSCKIFDVSPTAETYGAKTKLKVGDFISCLRNFGTSTIYVFVAQRTGEVGGRTAYCTHCGTDVKWLPWTGGSFGVAADAHFYLPNDWTYSGPQCTVNLGGKDIEIVLDLNGKKLTTFGSRAFLVMGGETLTIMDSVGGGEIAAAGMAGGASGALGMISGGHVNLLSGTLRYVATEGYGATSGGIFAMDSKATFTMYGGQLIGDQLLKSGKGGCLFIYDSSFTMYGGTMTGGKAQQGGNIYIEANVDGETSKVWITDDGNPETPAPVISGGTAGNGGNIMVCGTITIDAGTIENGSATQFGGNIYFEDTKAAKISHNVVGGTAVVTGGQAPGGGNICSYLGYFTLDGATITAGKASGEGHATLFGGGNIYCYGASINMKDATITDGICENAGGGNLLLGAANLFMDKGTIANGTAHKDGGNMVATNGSIVEIRDGAVTGGTVVGSYLCGGNVLVGHKSKLTLTGGTISGGTATYFGGALYVQSNPNGAGTATIDGGTVSGGSAVSGGTAYVEGSGVLNLKSGTISGGTATTKGGVLYLASGGTANVSGGTISGGTAVNGGNVCVDKATLSMTGGEITGGVATSQGGNINLVGANASFELNGGTVSGGTSTYHGGNIYQNSGTYVNIKKGTVSAGAANNSLGGNIAVEAATLTVSGGTITGGNAHTAGNIYLFSGATANISGGEITAGTAAKGAGGNINVTGSSTLNLSGGTVSGGTNSDYGGNIAVENATLNMSGGTISGGVSYYGGNLSLKSATTTFTGGVIENGGTPSNYGVGGNIWTNGSLTLGAVTINGGTAAASDNTISVAGDVTLNGTTVNDKYFTVKGKLTLAGNTTVYGIVLNGGLDVKADYTGNVRFDGVSKANGTAAGTILDSTKYTCEGPFTGTIRLDDFTGRPILEGQADGTLKVIEAPAAS